jgi:aldehyde:ferredoxin oxidoreductase
MKILTTLSTGFDPSAVSIPKRFTEVTTWKGQVDGDFLAGLKNAYSQSIIKLVQDEDQQRSKK